MPWPLGMQLLLLGKAVLLGSASQESSYDNIVLEWQAPQGCPQEPRVRQRIEQLLGNTVESSTGEHFTASGLVREQGGAWALDLSISTADGTEHRNLEATTCEALAEAAAVMISIALAPQANVVDPQPEPTEVSAISPPPAPPPSPESPDSPPAPGAEPAATPRAKPEKARRSPRSRRAPQPLPADRESTGPSVKAAASPISGFVRIVGGLSAGPLPGVAPGMGLGLGLRRRLLRAEVLARYYFARRADRGDVSGRIGYWSIAGSICVVPQWRLLEFPLCGGAEIGQMTGRGESVDESYPGRLVWAAGDVSAGLLVRLIPRIAVGIQADLVIPFTRPGFEVVGVGVLHRASVIGAAALAGIEFRFP